MLTNTTLTAIKGGQEATPQTEWKHSYLEKIKETLDKQDALIDALKKRVETLTDRSNHKIGDAFDKNEDFIAICDTNNRIKVLQEENIARRRYFAEFVNDFENKIKITNEHFDKVCEIAKRNESKNGFIGIAFDQYGTNHTGDIEKKVSFFYKLVGLTKYKI